MNKSKEQWNEYVDNLKNKDHTIDKKPILKYIIEQVEKRNIKRKESYKS
jgi:Trp operon repressor